MREGYHSGIGQRRIRPPFAITACLQPVLRLVFRRATLQVVDWHQTLSQVHARFFYGLRWGVAVCLLLVPVLFCPWPQSRRSLYNYLGKADWILEVSIVVVAGMGLAFAVTTRAKLRDTTNLHIIVPPLDIGRNLQDRAKTDCLGILLPLAVNLYSIYQFTHPNRLSYLFRQPMNPDTVVALGVIGLGIALFLHAIGFVPYERVPFLKFVLAAAAVALFIYGSSWPPAVR